MSILRRPDLVKLVMSVMTPRPRAVDDILECLVQKWGTPDYISPVIPFAYTDYYEVEMGKDLVRRLIAFEVLLDPEMLPSVKVETNALEARWSSEKGRRSVNIDPGYLSAAHLILATGKGFGHRPYLGRGVYADLTLMYKDGGFQPLPWTYPDYRSEQMKDILGGIRRKYLEQLRYKNT